MTLNAKVKAKEFCNTHRTMNYKALVSLVEKVANEARQEAIEEAAQLVDGAFAGSAGQLVTKLIQEKIRYLKTK